MNLKHSPTNQSFIFEKVANRDCLMDSMQRLDGEFGTLDVIPAWGAIDPRTMFNYPADDI
ncbi:hypothetical protein EI94DRAFT_1745353 [Lactarius quietus]|nr:hypothetical protein EI94DRAFT_1745353 [Lactarius quietus]